MARPFWILGGAALLTAGLGLGIDASVRRSAGGNLVRDEFEFTPNVFHTVPALTVAASAGFGALFALKVHEQWGSGREVKRGGLKSMVSAE